MNLRVILKVTSSSLMVIRHGILLYRTFTSTCPPIETVSDIADVITTREPERSITELVNVTNICLPEDE